MPKSELFSRLRVAMRAADALERSGTPTDVAIERAAEAAWSRRKFLRASASAAAGAAVAPLLFPRVARAQDAGRVVILGAGAAGLTCAYRLQQSGVASFIVEAAPRVGGRMYSLANYFPDDQIAELGGELIDTEHHAIRNLAKELGIELLDLAYLDGSAGHDYYFDGKLSKVDADWIEAFRPIAALVRREIGDDGANCDVTWNSGTERGKELDAMSIAQWLDKNGVTGTIRNLINAAYVGEFGLELDRQSALNFLCSVGTAPGMFELFGGSSERYRTRGGNATIPIRLAQELDASVQLGTAVEAIRSRDGGFDVAVRRGSAPATIKADILVTTIPLPVMRKLDLTRLDLTPIQREAIQKQGYGTNSKLMIGTNARPWVQMNVSAYTFTDLAFQACWETSRGQAGTHGILTNFTGGRQGFVVGEGALQDRARDFAGMADKVFPGVASAYTGQAVRQIWPKYEWSLGSYTCYEPGQYQRYYGALARPQGRLVFAGEHTVDESGFMNSAVESGERAAAVILGMLGLSRVRAA
ncbi:MAG: FAD-dependent oxidoreductase [Acidobacteria bacterium]|nr:FAD-dependent oxidoreductase [Acidobacteriota bacterium]MBV9474874.1 FAD-dependent oxidoreductase [Acidobacteriota bacterium]